MYATVHNFGACAVVSVCNQRSREKKSDSCPRQHAVHCDLLGAEVHILQQFPVAAVLATLSEQSTCCSNEPAHGRAKACAEDTLGKFLILVCIWSKSVLVVQENASRPDGLPPSQGGKYVGFGSSPGPTPKPQRGGGAGGLDDYQQYLSKGISQLTTVAGDHEACPSVGCGGAWGGGWGGRRGGSSKGGGNPA